LQNIQKEIIGCQIPNFNNVHNYPTAKTRTVYKSTDGPAGRPADNPPNKDGLGDLHRTVPKLTAQV
jgi:hypothetical protein